MARACIYVVHVPTFAQTDSVIYISNSDLSRLGLSYQVGVR